MFHPHYGVHVVPYREGVHSQPHHWREDLARQLSTSVEEPPGRGVETNRDGEQLVQEVHHSVLVNPNEGYTLKARDRVHPGGQVAQEAVEAMAGPLLHCHWSAVLPGDSKPH